MTLGDKLSKLREDNNYTQEQLASVQGVSRQAISKWESNITYTETDKLIWMSELFNCLLDYLLKYQRKQTVKISQVRSKSRFSECVCVRKKRKNSMGYAPVAYWQKRKRLCCRGLKCPWSDCSRTQSKRNCFPRYAFT